MRKLQKAQGRDACFHVLFSRQRPEKWLRQIDQKVATPNRPKSGYAVVFYLCFSFLGRLAVATFWRFGEATFQTTGLESGYAKSAKTWLHHQPPPLSRKLRRPVQVLKAVASGGVLLNSPEAGFEIWRGARGRRGLASKNARARRKKPPPRNLIKTFANRAAEGFKGV